MNVIGPKSIASALYRIVMAIFVLVFLSVLVMAIAPLLPTWPKYVGFGVQGGPLSVEFSPQNAGEVRWIWLMELTSRASHALVLYFLVRMLKPLKAGEPFHSKAPNQLRMIGGTVVLAALLRSLFCTALWNTAIQTSTLSYTIKGFLMTGNLGRGVDASGHGVDLLLHPSFDTDVIFLGIMLFVLAQIFSLGHVLKADSELTV
jgi:hypothetical protein